ncbi:MAG: GTP-binding protein [Mycobacterium sp.]|nr:GTP-binding protein [Mycobacterium sp.]
MTRPPIPVTVIGGYLGSGKTTLVNTLLRQSSSSGQNRRIAVLVNDFGDIGIDGDLIASAEGDTITLTNGCVCCMVGSDLMAALWSVRDREPPPAQVIIEASGIADPAAIAHHALTPGFDLDGVVVLLDAETVRRRERHPVVGRTIRRQLAAADVLVVNKIDLVSDGELADLDRWLADAAPAVPVIHARGGEVPVAALVGFGHGETLPVTEMGHAGDYVSLSITLDRPVVRERLEAFLDSLPAGVLRVKGILRLVEAAGERTVVHRVASRRAITTEGHWRAGEPGRLVVIALAGSLVAETFRQSATIQLADPAAG